MKRKKTSKPRTFAHLEVVVYDPSWYKPGMEDPTIKVGETVLYLGEIPNVSGHCAVAKHDGVILWLMHPEDFRKATDEEL